MEAPAARPKRPIDALAEKIVDDIDWLAREAEEQQRPVEMAPFRDRLFRLFAKAFGAGLLEDEADPNLSAEELTRLLGKRWELDNAARESIAAEQRLQTEDLSRMRILWAVMRLWMEWTYAWHRFEEFAERTEDG